FALFAAYNRHRLNVQYGVHALDIARVVASAPTVLNNISQYDAAPPTPNPGFVDELATGPIQSVASRVQQRTQVLFVVVANTHSIRLAAPDRDMLGHPVAGDFTQALAGREETAQQSTVFGAVIVAKVPVQQPGGRVLGIVSVGISTK